MLDFFLFIFLYRNIDDCLDFNVTCNHSPFSAFTGLQVNVGKENKSQTDTLNIILFPLTTENVKHVVSVESENRFYP